MPRKKDRPRSVWRDVIEEWLTHGNIVTTIITDQRIDHPTGPFIMVGEEICPIVGKSVQRPDGSWATLIVQFPES